jgi:tetratricopeptide (TPR) repeat protein
MNTETTSTETDPNVIPAELPEGAKLHFGIAEQGKLYAVDGDHTAALFYYRKAMQMSVERGDPEVFFRHYLDCVMESLEHMGSYAEIIDYCQKAIEIYEETPPENPITLRDQAHIYQKLGAVRLKNGETAEARTALRAGLNLLEGTGQSMALASSLITWLDRGMSVSAERVQTEQDRSDYFTVRAETLEPERAIKLPDEMMHRGLHNGAL